MTTWKSTITDAMLESIISDLDPKKTGGGKWEPMATDSLWQLAYELLQLRKSARSSTKAIDAKLERFAGLWVYWTGRILQLPDHNFPSCSTFDQLRDAMRANPVGTQSATGESSK